MPSGGKRERILALDLLRGYFLAVIVIDHLEYFPSVFELFTGRGTLWASAAEGFFIISGLLVGYIYTPRLARGFGHIWKKLWLRASQLYVCSVALTWFSYFVATRFGSEGVKAGIWVDPKPLEFLYKTLTLQYSYGWADFLQYYVLFMLIAPFAVYLCAKRMAGVVALTSIVFWIFRGQNFTMSLQLIFFMGLVIGYYLPSFEQYARSLTRNAQRLASYCIYGLALITAIASALTVRISSTYMRTFGADRHWPEPLHAIMVWFDWFHTLTRPYVDKWTMAPMRVIVAFIWFTALYILFRKYEGRINAITRRTIAVLGQNSLFMYSVHAILVLITSILIPGPYGFIQNSVLTAIILTLIYLITRYRNAHRTAIRMLYDSSAAKK